MDSGKVKAQKQSLQKAYEELGVSIVEREVGRRRFQKFLKILAWLSQKVPWFRR